MRLALLASVAVALPGHALAQDGPPPREGWSVTVGGAIVASPSWQGSGDTSVSLFPDLRAAWGDRFFASIPEGVGYNAVNEDGWKAGPIARPRFGRDEEDGGSPFRISGDSDDLDGLGDIDTAIEVGGFVEKRFGDGGQWRLRGEVRRGFGGHEGTLADASLTWQTRVGPALFSIGPRLSLASEDYMQTWFGIDAAQSAASGLAPYEAGGGLLSYGVGAAVIQPLNRQSAVTVFSSFERLGEEAANSPLVRERGDRDQLTVGVGYGFRFSF